MVILALENDIQNLKKLNFKYTLLISGVGVWGKGGIKTSLHFPSELMNTAV